MTNNLFAPPVDRSAVWQKSSRTAERRFPNCAGERGGAELPLLWRQRARELSSEIDQSVEPKYDRMSWRLRHIKNGRPKNERPRVEGNFRWRREGAPREARRTLRCRSFQIVKTGHWPSPTCRCHSWPSHVLASSMRQAHSKCSACRNRPSPETKLSGHLWSYPSFQTSQLLSGPSVEYRFCGFPSLCHRCAPLVAPRPYVEFSISVSACPWTAAHQLRRLFFGKTVVGAQLFKLLDALLNGLQGFFLGLIQECGISQPPAVQVVLEW